MLRGAHGGSLAPAPDFYDSTMDPAVTPVGARPNLVTSSSDFAVFMQMLANGGTYRGRKLLGAGTVEMLHTNQLGEVQLRDFTNDYLAGYGYGYGFADLVRGELGEGAVADLVRRALALAEDPAIQDLEGIHALGEGWVADEALAIAVFCAVRQLRRRP